jgi:hAT family C-terminal dimerisation region
MISTRLLNSRSAAATSQSTSDSDVTSPSPAAAEVAEPALKKWKCLAAKQLASAPARAASSGPQSEITKYLIEIRNSPVVTDAIAFWRQRRLVYPILAPLAEDLVAAPASQAYVERIFSVCGLFTAGRRNRMEKSLEMRTFLKLNSHLID